MSPLPFPAAPDTADAVLEALSREHLLLLLEADGAIRDCNRLADRALAAPGERCVGRSLRALLVTPEAPDRAGLWDALATARGWHGAVTVMSGDGTPLWIALTLSPRREGGHVGLGRLLPGEPERPTGAGGSGRSEAAAVAVAGPQDELLRNLVGVLVHELRTPIGGLTIGLDVVTRRLAKVGEERGFGEQYRGLLGRISEVLDELVQFVRPRSLRLAPVDLHGLVQDLAQRVPLHTGGTITVVPPDRPCIASADAVALADALGRLLRNACEASPEGAEVRVSVTSTADRCEVRVVDAGAGFAERVRSRLYQPFVTTKHRNLGLGLAAARQVVALHGGDLGVRPASGGGTEVWVALPAAPPSA